MSQITCNRCGERHEVWDECVPGRKAKYVTKRQATAGKPSAAVRQRPMAVKLHWADGRTTVTLGAAAPMIPAIEKVQPLYGAKDCLALSYHDATQQLAYSMHGVTLNQLSDQEAEKVRMLAQVTVNAAIGIGTKG